MADDDQLTNEWRIPMAPVQGPSAIPRVQGLNPSPAPPPPGLAPKMDAGQAPSPLSSFGAPPKSVMGTDVAPGQQISPEQMPKAEKLAANPKAEQSFLAQQDYHNQLKQFGDRRAMLDATMPTDTNDPNYLPNLVAHNAAKGAVQRDEAQFKLSHPWGSAGNHPGIGGKIGHVFGEIGNIAGAALAPNVTEMIPGSRLNLGAQAKMGQERENEALKQQTELEKAGAEQTTANARLEDVETNKEILAQAASDKAAQGDRATTVKEDALQAQLGEAVRNGDMPKAQEVMRMLEELKQAGKPTNASVQKGKLNGQDAYGFAHTNSNDPLYGKFTDQQGNVMDGFQPYPQQTPAGNIAIFPDPNGTGGGVAHTITPGTHIPAGAQNLSGFSGLGRPTTQERNIAAQAATTGAAIPGVIDEINQLGPELGPVMGRWNEFMQGKIGMENDKFAGLQTDLVMISSAVALAHARGRLPENLREEFDHMINAPQQDPKNLVAVLQHIQPYLERMKEMGNSAFTPKTDQTTNTPPATNPNNPLNIPGF